MNTHNIEKIIDYFSYVKKWLKTPTNEEENQRLINFAASLKNHSKNTAVRDLLDMIYKNIDEYERHAYPVGHKSPADILEFLIEQHHLTQSDLPEIGSQSHVSKILSGERHLTSHQISALSKRFGISPAVFYDCIDDEKSPHLKRYC